MNINAGAIVGGVFSLIALALFVRNSSGTVSIINGLSSSATSFANTIIGSGNGSGSAAIYPTGGNYGGIST